MVNVLFSAPPVIGEVSPGFLIKKEGDTLDMFCEAYSTPEPTLVWYMNDKLLEPSERISISGNRVQIRNLERTDGGVYKCMFKNVVGRASHEIKLVIEGECYFVWNVAFCSLYLFSLVAPINIFHYVCHLA